MDVLKVFKESYVDVVMEIEARMKFHGEWVGRKKRETVDI